MALNIAISGSTGMIGAELTDYFLRQGQNVVPLVRCSPAVLKDHSNAICWDIDGATIEQEKLCRQDIVIHLAGASISQRWTPKYKKLILSSRVKATRLLSNALANLNPDFAFPFLCATDRRAMDCNAKFGLKQKPRLFISASAIGYYGSHPADVMIDEESAAGDGFLADVCRQWEAETRPAADAGIRVVHLRLGVVLSQSGGALAKMLPIFNLGLGGVLGPGSQIISWVALKEIPQIIQYIIETESLSGAVNAVAPAAVTNREFTNILGQVLKRPVILPVPSKGIDILWGEMGRELLLKGAHVVPKKLQSFGYQFKYPDLRLALEDAINFKDTKEK